MPHVETYVYRVRGIRKDAANNKLTQFTSYVEAFKMTRALDVFEAYIAPDTVYRWISAEEWGFPVVRDPNPL